MARLPLFTLRLDPDERVEWDKAAAHAGVSVSEYVRSLVRKDITGSPNVPPTTTRQTKHSNRPSTGPCLHRVAPGTFCKKCAE